MILNNLQASIQPIIILSYISKLIEKVVAIQIKDHINLHTRENPLQSAYKSNHSTEKNSAQIKNDIHLNMAEDCAITLVLLDLCAAFETIDDNLLLQRLYSYFGFDGNGLSRI